MTLFTPPPIEPLTRFNAQQRRPCCACCSSSFGNKRRTIGCFPLRFCYTCH
jgi:hypothetical protein